MFNFISLLKLKQLARQTNANTSWGALQDQLSQSCLKSGQVIGTGRKLCQALYLNTGLRSRLIMQNIFFFRFIMTFFYMVKGCRNFKFSRILISSHKTGDCKSSEIERKTSYSFLVFIFTVGHRVRVTDWLSKPHHLISLFLQPTFSTVRSIRLGYQLVWQHLSSCYKMARGPDLCAALELYIASKLIRPRDNTTLLSYLAGYPDFLPLVDLVLSDELE